MMTEQRQWSQPLNMSGEIWLPVVGHETSYEVSSLGRVRRMARVCDPGNRSGWHIPASVVKLQTRFLRGGDRRPVVSCVLVYNGSRRATTVARLVHEAFIGGIPIGHQVLHRNLDSTDNRPENLYTLNAR